MTRGADLFGRSEFFFGISVKPRYVDFDLFHQSAEAGNLYGPFRTLDLSDDLPDLATELSRPLSDEGDNTTGWAGPDRLIWQGGVDARAKRSEAAQGVVFRLDIQVVERDSYGIGFSDNVVFHKQYYVQAFPDATLALMIHTGETYLSEKQPLSRDELEQLASDEYDAPVQRPIPLDVRDEGSQWIIRIGGTGFRGTLRLEITHNAP